MSNVSHCLTLMVLLSMCRFGQILVLVAIVVLWSMRALSAITELVILTLSPMVTLVPIIVSVMWVFEPINVFSLIF